MMLTRSRLDGPQSAIASSMWTVARGVGRPPREARQHPEYLLRVTPHPIGRTSASAAPALFSRRSAGCGL